MANPFEFFTTANPRVAARPAAAPQAPAFDIQSVLRAFAQAAAQQSSAQQQTMREFTGGIHRDFSGQPIDQVAGGPFGNGFFKTPTERSAIIAERQKGMPGAGAAATNPYFQSWLGSQATPPPTPVLPFTDMLSRPTPRGNPEAALASNARLQSSRGRRYSF